MTMLLSKASLAASNSNWSIITASPHSPKLALPSSTTSKPSMTAPDSTTVLTTKPQLILNPNLTKITLNQLSVQSGRSHVKPFPFHSACARAIDAILLGRRHTDQPHSLKCILHRKADRGVSPKKDLTRLKRCLT